MNIASLIQSGGLRGLGGGLGIGRMGGLASLLQNSQGLGGMGGDSGGLALPKAGGRGAMSGTGASPTVNDLASIFARLNGGLGGRLWGQAGHGGYGMGGQLDPELLRHLMGLWGSR